MKRFWIGFACCFLVLGILGAKFLDETLFLRATTTGVELFRLESQATNDNPNFSIQQDRVATTDSSTTTIGIIPTVADRTYYINTYVVARRTGGASGIADDGAVYYCSIMFRTLSGILTGTGPTCVETESQTSWTVQFNAPANDIQIRVRGSASNDVTWHATTFIQQVGS